MIDFFILAGGRGERAMPLTQRLPKPLFPLSGKPLLSLLSEQMRSAGLKKGFINVHHLAGLITGYPLSELNIAYIHEENLSGNRILSDCSGSTGKDLIVVNGDTFLDIPVEPLIRELNTGDCEGVILVRKKDGIYSSIISDGNIFRKREKDPGASGVMYTGVSIFRNQFLRELNKENLFDSLESSGGKIRISEYNGPWFDLGTPENYFMSDRNYRESIGVQPGNSLSPGAEIRDNARVTNSIIWHDSVIRGDAVVSDSIITDGLEIDSGIYRNKIVSKDGIFDLRIRDTGQSSTP